MAQNNNTLNLMTQSTMKKLLILLTDLQICKSFAWDELSLNKTACVDWYALPMADYVKFLHCKSLIYILMQKNSKLNKIIARNIADCLDMTNVVAYEKLVTILARIFFEATLDDILTMLEISFTVRGLDITKDTILFNLEAQAYFEEVEAA